MSDIRESHNPPTTRDPIHSSPQASAESPPYIYYYIRKPMTKETFTMKTESWRAGSSDRISRNASPLLRARQPLHIHSRHSKVKKPPYPQRHKLARRIHIRRYIANRDLLQVVPFPERYHSDINFNHEGRKLKSRIFWQDFMKPKSIIKNETALAHRATISQH